MSRFYVDEDISRARTLDKAFYNSPALFDECREKLFGSSWQFIGNEDLLSDEHNVYPFTLLQNYLDEPLVLTRDKDQQLHLLSNTCTHRGNIIADQHCRASNLRCKYHGRIFQLDGHFHSMPEFREVKEFPGPEDNLKKLPLFTWGKWLFTSLSPTNDPQIFFREMMNRVSWMPLRDFHFRPELSREFAVHAHWALYCENYLEGFHIPFVHAGLNAVIDFGNYTTELFTFSNLQLGIAKENEDCFEIPAGTVDSGEKIAAYYFYVFPNMMFNFYPWGLSVNIVEPVSLQETRVRFLTYVWNQTKYNTGAGS
jgi:choline monooxygenase